MTMANRKHDRYFPPDEKAPLVAEFFRRVQFDEVDPLRIVWHGRYPSYFEQGRNEWGRKFGFRYQDMLENGFAAPIIRFHADHFHPLRYDECMRIITRCHWTEAAKLNYSYEIYSEDHVLAARGYTVQLYTDLSGKPLILRPEFVERFMQKWDEWSLK
jgi:acyl-CoA thioester hydrolase